MVLFEVVKKQNTRGAFFLLIVCYLDMNLETANALQGDLGPLVKDARKIKLGTTSRFRATVSKIDRHSSGKYHLKVYKKHWFTLVVVAGVPEYVAQGMLGRKQYLDQYLRLPLEKDKNLLEKF